MNSHLIPPRSIIGVLAAGGVGMCAAWAAARDAVAPDHAAPGFGFPVSVALVRAVTGWTLDPLIGTEGSRLIFCAVLAVIAALTGVMTILVSNPQSGVLRGDRRLACHDTPHSTADPAILPVTRPWPHGAGAAARPTENAQAHRWPVGHTSDRDHHPYGEHRPEPPPACAPHGRPQQAPRADVGGPAGVSVLVGNDAAGRGVTVDLCAHHGVGLVGPGADDCARHLLATLITPPHTTTAASARFPMVVIPATELERLLAENYTCDHADDTPHPPPAWHSTPRDTPPHRTEPPEETSSATTPPCGRTLTDPDLQGCRLYRAPTMEAALTYLEQQLLTRARGHHTRPDTHHNNDAHDADTVNDNDDGFAPVVLIAHPDPAEQARLQAILTHGAHYRITAILTRPWPPGTTLTVETDGSARATPEPQFDLRPLTRVRSISPHQLADLLLAPTTTAHLATGAPPAPHNAGRTPEASTAPTPAVNPAQPAPQPNPTPSQTPPPVTSRTGPTPSVEPVLIVECFAGLRVHTPATTTAADTPKADAMPRREITGQLSPQDARLLACLALHPDGIPTDTLLRIGWPRTPQPVAGQRLRTALNHLRTTLREATHQPQAMFAAHSHGRYHLATESAAPHIWVDHTAFIHTVRESRNQDGQARVDALHHIAALYTGPVLAGVDLDWPELEAIQEAARRSAVSALAQLAEHYQHRDPTQAIHLLRTLLEHNPTAESAATRLITLQLQQQDYRAAQRTYTNLTHHLGALGRHPSPALTTAVRNQRRAHPT